MDNRIRLLELQQGWTPPAELRRSPPRQVRLTVAGKAVAALGAALLAGALIGSIVLGVVAARQAGEQRLLSEQGVETEARITRLWRSRNEKRQPWVAYLFSVNGRVYERQVKAPFRVWRNLSLDSTLPVRYLPSNPMLNHPSAWYPGAVPQWLPYAAAAFLVFESWLVTWSLRRQWQLLRDGRAAPGLVTHHTAAKGGKIAHFEFAVLSGAIRSGRSTPSKKPPAVGSTICVLYDAEKPRRNAPYPLSLVRTA